MTAAFFVHTNRWFIVVYDIISIMSHETNTTYMENFVDPFLFVTFPYVYK